MIHTRDLSCFLRYTPDLAGRHTLEERKREDLKSERERMACHLGRQRDTESERGREGVRVRGRGWHAT